MEIKVADGGVLRNYKWKPPEAGLPKLNIDAAVVKGCTYVGVGAVVRDHCGCSYDETSGQFWSVHC
ncbi:hypothetical protein TorRG33x02_027460 [Trema orientale]|uniref:Uncharacterized protein n=1 Tax=Trema orientale TaxID=63057 RepID=A0A2P5FUI9_TREOI|nr:hypothetical protein TorRG33x02_027460 [Trema orientale]